MPTPGWLTSDPVEQRPAARAVKGWSPRPKGKVKLMPGWEVPETGAGQGEDGASGVGIGPDKPLAPALPTTSPWAEDLRRSTLPSAVPSPSLTAPATPAIPSSGSSTLPNTAAPSSGPVGVLKPSAAAPVPSPVRVPPQGGQATAPAPSPNPKPGDPWTWVGAQPSVALPTSQTSAPTPLQSVGQTQSLPTPTPSAPGDLVDQTRQAAVAAGIDPDIFARQIKQESGFNPNAKSPAGALGIAQFMPDTAKGLNINPNDPSQALPAAAKLMRSYLDMYGGDYKKALAAYNAGPGAVDKYNGVPPFKETQAYVSAIYGDGPTTASTGNTTASAPQAVHAAARTSQFDMSLSSADAMAFCGPAAAMAFAATYGRNPTVDEAKALAIKVGWNPQQGMAGVGSEQKLLEDLGIKTQLEPKINWDHVATDASNGNPVIIDTPGHYFYVDGYDASSGKFHVGTSGTDLKGGNEWMTASQINAMPQSDGDARAALYADHPLSSTPSVFVSGRSQPNDQASATAQLPPGLQSLPSSTSVWGSLLGGGTGSGQDEGDNPVQGATGWLQQRVQDATAGGIAGWGNQQLNAAANQTQDQADPLKRQYPIVGPTGILGIADPRLGGKGDEGGAPLDTTGVGDINVGDVAQGSEVEDPGAYPGGGPGYTGGLPQGPPSPPPQAAAPAAPLPDLSTIQKGAPTTHSYIYDPSDQAVHQFTSPWGENIVVVKDTVSGHPDTQYLFVNEATGQIEHKEFNNSDPSPTDLETTYQNWLTGPSPSAIAKNVLTGTGQWPGPAAQPASAPAPVPAPAPGPVQGPQPMGTQQLPLPNMNTSVPPKANWTAPLPPYSGWKPPSGLDDAGVAQVVQSYVAGDIDEATLSTYLGTTDMTDVQAYALQKAQSGDRTLVQKLPALLSHRFSNHDIGEPWVQAFRDRMKAGTDGLHGSSPYAYPQNWKSTGVPLGDQGGAGEIYSSGTYFDSNPYMASQRANPDAYAQVWSVKPDIPKDRILNLRDDQGARDIMKQVVDESNDAYNQSTDPHKDFGKIIYADLRNRGYAIVYNGGYAHEPGETMLVTDDPSEYATLVADGSAKDMIQKLANGPQWGPGIAGGLIVGLYYKSQQDQGGQGDQATPQASGAGQDESDTSGVDMPWWQRAAQGVVNLPGAVASGVGSIAGTLASDVGSAASNVASAVQSTPGTPGSDVSSLPSSPPSGARTLADVAGTADQPQSSTLTPLPASPVSLPDYSQSLVDQGKTAIPNIANPQVPAQQSLVQAPPPPQPPGQPILPQPGPDARQSLTQAPLAQTTDASHFALPQAAQPPPATAIEKVTRGETGSPSNVKLADQPPSSDPVTQAARSILQPGAHLSLSDMVDSVAHDPVADISDNGYRGQLRKAAEKAIINVDGGPLQMLFDPTLAAFGTQAPVQVAVNALFGQDPLTGVITQEGLGVAGKALGKLVGPFAPAKAVATAAQKALQTVQLPGTWAAKAATAGVNAAITRGLDSSTLTAARSSLTDKLDANAQADVLEAAGAYLRDSSLDAEALRLRRMTNLITPLSGKEIVAQVTRLAQKAGKPELADTILKDAGYGELTSPYTTALDRLGSVPARSIPEIARSSTNLLVGGTLGAAYAGLNAGDPNDPNYQSKLLTGAGIGAGALIGMPYVAHVLSTTVAPNLLANAREFAGNIGNLRGPTQPILRDFVSQKQVIEYLRNAMADDIRQAFGSKDNWPTVFKYLEEHGTLPPELQGSRKANAVWQEILDSNARALARGDINDVTTMAPRTLGFNSPQAYLHHAVDSDWREAMQGATRYDPTPPRSGFRGNPIAQYTRSREYATVGEGEATGGIKYNYDLDKILSSQWANQQQQALNEVLEGNLRGIAVDPTALGAGVNAVDHDVLADVDNAFLPKGYSKGNDLLPDLNISPQLRSSLGRLYGDRGFQNIPGVSKVYAQVAKFFGGLKVGMLAGSGFHLLNEWNQFGASQGMWDAESKLPELTQMAFSRGTWRSFLDIHKATITHAIGDGLTFDPFSKPETDVAQRLVQAGLLGGGGYATGYQTAKQKGKNDQEAAAWGAIGAGLGAGMAVPFFGKNGALVDVFTDALFHRTIPMMKLQAYIAHGATPEAAEFANEAFGGINADRILRSRWFSDGARLGGFAPDWTEGFWRQAGRALWDTGPDGKMQRQFWANVALNGTYMISGLNLALSGHWPWQNEPGHEMEVETTGLMDRHGWNRVPAGSTTGVPVRTYMDVIPAWRSLMTPPWETARWLLAAAASTPQGQQLGLDNPHITGMQNGVQVALKPDPAKAWSSYLSNRQGLIPATLTSALAQTDYAGRPLSLPNDTAMDSVTRAMSSALQKLSPLGPGQGIEEALSGEPLPMAIFSGATGLREYQSNPSAVAAQSKEQLRQEVTGDNAAQQRKADQDRNQYNAIQQQRQNAIMDDPTLTPADKLAQVRKIQFQNVDVSLESQIPPEIYAQNPTTAAGMVAQINAMAKAAQSAATNDPADLPNSGEINTDDLFAQSWNRDPSQLTGKTPDQQWVQRQQWTVQTAQEHGLDQRVVEDVVKAHLYGIPMPAVPGVSSFELDQLAQDWKGTGDDSQPASQQAQRQTLMNDFAQQKGIDPNALSARVRLRILQASDQSPDQQSYSRALTVLEAAHNPATSPVYVNEDGSPMGTSDDWVKWDQRLSANSDKYDKVRGRYIDPSLETLSQAKARGAVLPAGAAYASKNYWDYAHWFGVGRAMTDAQWQQYRAGTLPMWTDTPDPKEALHREDVLAIYAALTPDQRATATTSIVWQGKTYTRQTYKNVVKWLGLVKSDHWKDLGLDPGIDPGAPGVDTGFQ
jgi:hypothetical protein